MTHRICLIRCFCCLFVCPFVHSFTFVHTFVCLLVHSPAIPTDQTIQREKSIHNTNTQWLFSGIFFLFCLETSECKIDAIASNAGSICFEQKTRSVFHESNRIYYRIYYRIFIVRDLQYAAAHSIMNAASFGYHSIYFTFIVGNRYISTKFMENWFSNKSLNVPQPPLSPLQFDFTRNSHSHFISLVSFDFDIRWTKSNWERIKWTHEASENIKKGA